ncbi:hypothetical protein PIROE2DRAFT_15555, partial [Piromyces sp. E2]
KKDKTKNSKHLKTEIKNAKDTSVNVLVGPQLPPELNKNSNIPKNNDISNNEKNFVGPMLPSFINNNEDVDSYNNDNNNSSIIGPTLNKSEQKSKVIGPSMPPSFNNDDIEHTSNIVGPSLPQNISNIEVEKEEEESDDDIIGPLPMAPGHELTEEEETQRIVKEFEERAERMKRKLEGKDEPEKPKKLVRDEWMTTLPEDNILDRINVLKPRQFRKNGVTKIDRSGWTDTPADKLRKQKEGIKDKNEKIEYIQINKNDIEMQKMIDKYNKEHRNESLYDQHAKEYFKNKKYEENDISKLPFDRERDVLGSGSKGSIGKTNALKSVLGVESANRFTHSTIKRFL